VDHKIHEELNKQVANWSLLYTKFHHYHWYVKGSTFFELHSKFEELYREADSILDELAERLLSIGGKPVSTFPDILAKASIQEATGTESTEQMIKQLVQDFQQLSGELRDGIAIADEAKDYPTADMLTGVLTKIEKYGWMFESYIGGKTITSIKKRERSLSQRP
jgi:starvation-inducible DNA-binding protein